jgi:hypothetical protein
MLSMRLFGVGSLLSLLSTPYWRLKVDMVRSFISYSFVNHVPKVFVFQSVHISNVDKLVAGWGDFAYFRC